jgi:hypothetical protein
MQIAFTPVPAAPAPSSPADLLSHSGAAADGQKSFASLLDGHAGPSAGTTGPSALRIDTRAGAGSTRKVETPAARPGAPLSSAGQGRRASGSRSAKSDTNDSATQAAVDDFASGNGGKPPAQIEDRNTKVAVTQRQDAATGLNSRKAPTDRSPEVLAPVAEPGMVANAPAADEGLPPEEAYFDKPIDAPETAEPSGQQPQIPAFLLLGGSVQPAVTGGSISNLRPSTEQAHIEITGPVSRAAIPHVAPAVGQGRVPVESGIQAQSPKVDPSSAPNEPASIAPIGIGFLKPGGSPGGVEKAAIAPAVSSTEQAATGANVPVARANLVRLEPVLPAEVTSELPTKPSQVPNPRMSQPEALADVDLGEPIPADYSSSIKRETVEPDALFAADRAVITSPAAGLDFGKSEKSVSAGSWPTFIPQPVDQDLESITQPEVAVHSLQVPVHQAGIAATSQLVGRLSDSGFRVDLRDAASAAIQKANLQQVPVAERPANPVQEAISIPGVTPNLPTLAQMMVGSARVTSSRVQIAATAPVLSVASTPISQPVPVAVSPAVPQVDVPNLPTPVSQPTVAANLGEQQKSVSSPISATLTGAVGTKELQAKSQTTGVSDDRRSDTDNRPVSSGQISGSPQQLQLPAADTQAVSTKSDQPQVDVPNFQTPVTQPRVAANLGEQQKSVSSPISATLTGAVGAREPQAKSQTTGVSDDRRSDTDNRPVSSGQISGSPQQLQLPAADTQRVSTKSDQTEAYQSTRKIQTTVESFENQTSPTGDPLGRNTDETSDVAVRLPVGREANLRRTSEKVASLDGRNPQPVSATLFSAGEKQLQNVGGQKIEIPTKEVGISAAKEDETMLATAPHKLVDEPRVTIAEPPQSAVGVASGTLPANRTSSDTQTLRGHAVTAVRETIEAAERAQQLGRNSVEIRIQTPDSENLRVFIRWNEGAVHARFVTQTAEMQQALSREWSQAASQLTEKSGIRFGDASFTRHDETSGQSQGNQNGFSFEQGRQSPRGQGGSFNLEDGSLPTAHPTRSIQSQRTSQIQSPVQRQGGLEPQITTSDRRNLRVWA